MLFKQIIIKSSTLHFLATRIVTNAEHKHKMFHLPPYDYDVLVQHQDKLITQFNEESGQLTTLIKKINRKLDKHRLGPF